MPKVKLKSHQPSKWLAPAIRHHLNHIHPIRKKVKCNPSPYNLIKLHNEEQQLEILMTRAQTEYEAQLFNNTSSNCEPTSFPSENWIPQHVHFFCKSTNYPSEKLNH